MMPGSSPAPRPHLHPSAHFLCLLFFSGVISVLVSVNTHSLVKVFRLTLCAHCCRANVLRKGNIKDATNCTVSSIIKFSFYFAQIQDKRTNLELMHEDNMCKTSRNLNAFVRRSTSSRSWLSLLYFCCGGNVFGLVQKWSGLHSPHLTYRLCCVGSSENTVRRHRGTAA